MLSNNLSWGEFTATEHRDRDIVLAQRSLSLQVVSNAHEHATEVWQPFRDLVGPVRVSSGYRCAVLNRLVGGSRVSAHMFGRATDNVPLKMSLAAAMSALVASTIPYDKVIWEFGRWIHLQSPRQREEPRRTALMTWDALDYVAWNPDDLRVKEMTA